MTKAQRGLGFDYIGTLLVADRDCHHDVRIAADEGGMTATHEALVTAHLAELGEWDDDAICSVERFFKLQEFAGAPPPTRSARISLARPRGSSSH